MVYFDFLFVIDSLTVADLLFFVDSITFRSAVPRRFDHRCQSAVRDRFAVCRLKNVEGSRDEERGKVDEGRQTKRTERGVEGM
jgi:hypothetical protein